MPDVADLRVKITADTANAERGLQRTSDHVSKLTGLFGQATSTAIGFASAIAGMSTVQSIFGAIKGAVIDFNASLEQSRIAFTTMLGSASQADSFLRDLANFAAKTPFEFPDVVQGARRLMAMGFSAEQVRPLLESVGNAASALGLGREGIDRITLALGQMNAKTKISGEEMRQLTEAGVPAWRILAEAMGVTTQEAMKAAEQGRVTSDVFIEAFQKWVGSNWGGMMEKQSHTFLGAMSTIKDSLTMVASTALKPVFDGISGLADKFAQFVSSDEFKKWAEDVAGKVQNLMSAVGDLAGKVIEFGEQAYGALTSKGIPGLFELIGQKVSEIDFSSILGKLEELASQVGEKIQGIASDIVSRLSKIDIGDLGSKISSALQNIKLPEFSLELPFGITIKSEDIEKGLHDLGPKIQEALGTGTLGEKVSGLVSQLTPFLTTVQQIASIIGTVFAPTVANMGIAFQNIGIQIGPVINDLGARLGPILQNLMPIIGAVAAILGGALLIALKLIADILSVVLPPAFTIVVGVLQVFLGLLQIVTSILGGTVNMIVKLLQGDIPGAVAAMQASVSGVFEGIGSIITGVANVILGSLGVVLGFLLGPFTGGFDSISTTIGGIWTTISGSTTLTWEGIKTKLNEIWTWARDTANSIFGGIETFLSTTWTNIKTGVDTAWGEISTIFSRVWGEIVKTAKGAVNDIIGFLNSLIGAWNNLDFKIPGFSATLPKIEVPGIGTVGGQTLSWPGVEIKPPPLPTIPKLAQGGIVTSPTLALVGEGGPEAVVPLSRTPTGNVINVVVNVSGSVVAERDLAAVVRNELLRLGKRNLNVGLA
jgi:tape measure domain-containing protein